MDKNKEIVLIHANWDTTSCVVSSIFDEVEKEYNKEVCFQKLDIEKVKGEKAYFQMIPALVYKIKDKEVFRHIGMISKENLVRQLDIYLLNKKI
ncbi:MAG: hypothetical protein ACEPOW_13320 [Bacteroidales bacterium]